MKEKFEKLEKFMAHEGLTLEDVHAYCVNELEKERLVKEVLEKRRIIAGQITQLQTLQEEKANKSLKDSPQR